METPTDILVPLDGSAEAEEALAPAISLVSRGGGRIHLVQVRTLLGGGPQAPGAPPPRSIEDAIAGYLKGVARRIGPELKESPVAAVLRDPESDRLYGGPSRHAIAGRIAEYADAKGIGLIVLTSHGRGGFDRAWLGTVADGLMRTANVPLLLIRENAEEAVRPPFRRILVPLDGSRAAATALKATRLVAAPDAEYTLLEVVSPTYETGAQYRPGRLQTEGEAVDMLRARADARLESAARMLPPTARARLQTPVHESPASAILGACGADAADLIALTTRGRGNAPRYAVGSLADKVVRGAVCPVLVINPPAGTDGDDVA